MRNFRIAAAAALIALSLGGCASVTEFGQKVEGVVSAVTGATVSPEAIIILANSFDALQVTAKNYINPALNKRCNGSNGPICRDPNATRRSRSTRRSARAGWRATTPSSSCGTIPASSGPRASTTPCSWLHSL